MNKRTMLVVPSLGSGGAERNVSLLANHWAANGHEVAILTLDGAPADFFTLAPAVRRVRLPQIAHPIFRRHAILRNIHRSLVLREKIVAFRPDTIISFTSSCNVLMLLATRGLKLRTIVSERSDPAQHAIGVVWNLLRRFTYRWARFVIAQTDATASWLHVHMYIPRARIKVIPNPALCVEDIGVGGRGETGGRVLLAVGRLSHEKGFDLLLSAFARIATKHPEWRLCIVGDGAEREALGLQAQHDGIEDRVDFCPARQELSSIYRAADLYVLPSRFEGFPNSLLEAMATGLAAVGFDGSAGPREIIRHTIDGLLVPSANVSALADALSTLMDDAAKRHQFGERAREVVERFALKEVIARWSSVCYDDAAHISFVVERSASC